VHSQIFEGIATKKSNNPVYKLAKWDIWIEHRVEFKLIFEDGTRLLTSIGQKIKEIC